MARRYSRDSRGRFASGGGGATARGGRLKTAAGNKRTARALEGKARTVKAAGAKTAGTIGKPKGLKPGAIKTKSAATTRKGQLATGAQRRNAQANRIDAKVKALEGQYRSKDAAFYTQGAKPAARDRMIAKSQQAAQLREQSAALRTKAANAEKMAIKIKDKPIKTSGGDAKLGRAIKNEAAGSTQARRNPKGYQKRITALTAQKVYKTGDFMAGVSVAQAAGKGFRLPRSQRKASVATAAKKRIAVTTFKTNTDLGRRGVVSMSARAKVRRSQNVKSLATEKGKGVLERIQGAGFRRGSRETKYNAPGSAGAKRIAKTAATQSRAKAFAQQQVYNKGGGAYRGQRPEFNWKRSRRRKR